MFGDLSGAEGLKLICDVSESVKYVLDILIVISLKAVEEVAKDTDSLILESQSQTNLDVFKALTRPYCPLVR